MTPQQLQDCPGLRARRRQNIDKQKETDPMKPIKLTVFAAALVLSGVALAAEKPDFAGADANSDGMVDEAEFKATGIEKDFGELDADGDGSLNGDEYKAALEEDCA
jgi:hypothetical protein